MQHGNGLSAVSRNLFLPVLARSPKSQVPGPNGHSDPWVYQVMLSWGEGVVQRPALARLGDWQMDLFNHLCTTTAAATMLPCGRQSGLASNLGSCFWLRTIQYIHT